MTANKNCHNVFVNKNDDWIILVIQLTISEQCQLLK